MANDPDLTFIKGLFYPKVKSELYIILWKSSREKVKDRFSYVCDNCHGTKITP